MLVEEKGAGVVGTARTRLVDIVWDGLVTIRGDPYEGRREGGDCGLRGL